MQLEKNKVPKGTHGTELLGFCGLCF